MQLKTLLATTLLLFTQATCQQPLLTVGDFDGDGEVTGQDIAVVAQQVGDNIYRALYDRNADGTIDSTDVVITTNELGNMSTPLDQELAAAFHMSEFLLELGPLTAPEWSALGFLDAGILIGNQGRSATAPDGLAVLFGLALPGPDKLMGVVIDEDGYAVGIYYFEFVLPVDLLFKNDSGPPSEYDVATCQVGCDWWTKEVVEFVEPFPNYFSTDCEWWTAIGGLCVRQYNDSVQTPAFELYLTAYQCLVDSWARPEGTFDPGPASPVPPILWLNEVKLVTWLFKLNPNGVFAPFHPDVAVNATPYGDFGDRALMQYGQTPSQFFTDSINNDPCQ